MFLGAKTLNSERLLVVFRTTTAKNTVLLQTSCVIRQLFYLGFAEKLHLVPILFILESKGMFNAVEFHKTTQNSCITLNSLLRSLITLGNLLQLFHVPQHLHVHVCVLSLVLGQEVFKVLVHCM